MSFIVSSSSFAVIFVDNKIFSLLCRAFPDSNIILEISCAYLLADSCTFA